MAMCSARILCHRPVSGGLEEIIPHDYFAHPESPKREPRTYLWCKDHEKEVRAEFHQLGVHAKTLSESEAQLL